MNTFTLPEDKGPFVDLVLKQLERGFFFYASSGGLTTLKMWDRAGRYSETTVRCAISLKLGNEGVTGTLEWVKAIIYEKATAGPDGLAVSNSTEALASIERLNAVFLNKRCLQGEERDANRNLVVFGCSGDSPAAYVLPYEVATNLDCAAPLPPTHHVIIPRYLVSNDGSLHPKEIWASEKPMAHSPDSAEGQLQAIARRTSNEATRIARLSHKSGDPSPKPFLSPRTMQPVGFPVLVRNTTSGNQESNQYVRFGISQATPVSRVELIVFGVDSMKVDQAFDALWKRANVPGAPPDFSSRVDVYRCGKNGTALIGSRVDVVYEHQPHGVNEEIILGITFPGS